MDIFEKESKLFDEWSKSREGFVSDGVVSKKDYVSSNLKLCFVLKEVNDFGGGGWDLREFIKQGSCGNTWNNITRWVTCIDNINADIPWAALESIDESNRAEKLLPICAMNLKKSPGSSTTVQAEFEEVVEEDQSFIRQQYGIYKPDLTICCGTGWDLRYVLGLNDGDILETSNGVKWFKNNDTKPVVIYKHPQAWINDEKLAYDLVESVREILA